MSVLENAAGPNRKKPFSLAQGVEILPTSDSALNGQARLVVAGGRYYHLDGFASLLLIALESEPRTGGQLQQHLLQSSGISYDGKKIEETLERLAAYSIITDGTREIEDRNKKKASSYFAVKFPLISAGLLRPLVRILSPIFAPALVAWLFSLMFIGQIVFWFFEHKIVPGLYHLPNGYVLLALLLANYVGLFLHEFGHAAACARFGARHGAIGFALYLIFPALYTDVTDSWRLAKTKRVIVDAGGTYMSLMAATLASLLFLEFKAQIFAQLCFLYGFVVIVNLNPFFRMDGYWVISDVLGVPNLMAANREVTWWLLRFGSEKLGARPRVLYLPFRVKFAYFAYYTAFLIFMAFSGYAFYEWYIPQAIHLIPFLAHELSSSLADQGLSLHVLGLGFRMLVQSIPLLAPTIYMARSVGRMARRRKAELRHLVATKDSSVTKTPVSAA